MLVAESFAHTYMALGTVMKAGERCLGIVIGSSSTVRGGGWFRDGFCEGRSRKEGVGGNR